MTDAKIIKALECCSQDTHDCDNCPLDIAEESLCFNEIKGYALDLINRQKAEYEDLYKKYCELAKITNEKVPVLIKEVQKSKEELKAEAIKEFADIFVEKIIILFNMNYSQAENAREYKKIIVNEMAGDTE